MIPPLLLRLLPLLFCLLTMHPARGQAVPEPSLPSADRIRLAEAFRLKAWIGERVWPGWSRTIFPVLLVTRDQEFLVGHPAPSDDFRPLGRDALLGQEVLVRKRVFPPNLMATFPAVNGISTVVVGQAPNTDSPQSTAWVLTLLHEHFHQWQSGAPGYFASVDSLGLSGGDKTGMWMLNYPFPYAKPAVAGQFRTLSRSLARALDTSQGGADTVAAAQSRLASLVSPDEFRYLDFQLWQEGVARYTELRVAELAASGYQPDAQFAALPDFRPYGRQAATIRAAMLRELKDVKLAEQRRVAVYAMGAGLALLLDREQPEWRMRYLEQPFTLSKPVEAAAPKQVDIQDKPATPGERVSDIPVHHQK
ncbi:hypothetical protein [Massilia sp. ST3]|uniref:hypothetical protein n=1 Tax=Massilia sp. ST3 TaxID=2824903 RepID=UPI001B83C1BE|nr:hypothetical protein [Massilia sp. ST3]MBQ5948554.1 hypothetical protein [Massilia sp. ST3]